jgi:hypothetical protein
MVDTHWCTVISVSACLQVRRRCPTRQYRTCFVAATRRRYEVLPHWNATPCHQTETSQAVAAPKVPSQQQPARCTSPLDVSRAAHISVLIGAISTASPAAFRRRQAARRTWLTDKVFHSGEWVACFVLSNHSRPSASVARRRETTKDDLLFVDAPESWQLITSNTLYSGGRKPGRGMPTFKIYAFLKHAAFAWPRANFIMKLDDDTLLNPSRLHSYLAGVDCRAHVLLGAIHWSGVVPRSNHSGVRIDRCAWGWSTDTALYSFHMPVEATSSPCDEAGSLLPLPFAAGAGYVLSAAAAHWVGTNTDVAQWVSEASGGDHERLQWQKYEDTTLGYWLAYAPFRVTYVDVGRHSHQLMACSKDNEADNGVGKATSIRALKRGNQMRPPTSQSVFVHDLKESRGVRLREWLAGWRAMHQSEEVVRQVGQPCGGAPRREVSLPAVGRSLGDIHSTLNLRRLTS